MLEMNWNSEGKHNCSCSQGVAARASRGRWSLRVWGLGQGREQQSQLA